VSVSFGAMNKIKLPWRRFGEERPDHRHVLVWTELKAPFTTFLKDMFHCSGEHDEPYWYNEELDIRCAPDDHWMYLDELEAPYGKDPE